MTFRKKYYLTKKYVFWFSLQLLSATFLILRRNQGNTATHVNKSSCKVPLFLSDSNETWIFSVDFRKIIKYQLSWKFFQWETNYFMPAGGRTDMTKVIVAFLNFASSPNDNTVPTGMKNALERPERRWRKQQNWILKKYGWQRVDWINLAQARDQSQILYMR